MSNDYLEGLEVEVVPDDVPTVTYGENLNQGHNMYLGDRIKLGAFEMIQLKEIIDTQINFGLVPMDTPPTYDVHASQISGLKLSVNNDKLIDIPVNVEYIDGRILVKVGPCDLSGVGGHSIREQIIKNLVNQALEDKCYDALGFNFENVNVSACVGVRGRSQMFCSWFYRNNENIGSHMNAYVKTANERGLTHWEPRQGPQRFYNDTICAMVTSTTTSLFENGIRNNSITSAQQATTNILKHPSLVAIFDNLLAQTKNRISCLVESVKKLILTSNDEIAAIRMSK